MALKRNILQQQSRRQISVDNSYDYDNTQAMDETNEQNDSIESLTNLTSEQQQQQHRDRRRSSLQIFDIKFLHNLSNQVDSINTAEDECECE
jgi:hypothetical protein